MTKNEIQNGMYVKLRNGVLSMKIADKLINVNGNYNLLGYYHDDLTHGMSNEWDIMGVYISSSPANLFDENKLERIWVRKENHTPEVGDLYVIDGRGLNLSHDDIYLILDIKRDKDGDISYDVLNIYGNNTYFDTWYGKLDDTFKFIKAMPDVVEKFNSVIKSIKETYGEI